MPSLKRGKSSRGKSPRGKSPRTKRASKSRGRTSRGSPRNRRHRFRGGTVVTRGISPALPLGMKDKSGFQLFLQDWASGSVFSSVFSGGDFLHKVLDAALTYAQKNGEGGAKGTYNKFVPIPFKAVEQYAQDPLTADKELGLRFSLEPSDANDSVLETYMTLKAAEDGVGPAVFAVRFRNKPFPLFDKRPVYLFEKLRSMEEVLLDYKTDVPALSFALVELFWRTSQKGFLLLDVKASNMVMKTTGQPRAYMIDFDPGFTRLKDGTSTACLLIVNITLFLIGVSERCETQDFGYERSVRRYGYPQAAFDGVRKLLAETISAQSAPKSRLASLFIRSMSKSSALQSELCGVLDDMLFQDRIQVENVALLIEPHEDVVKRVASNVLFMAGHYGIFDGGHSSMVKCPIPGLKFDLPIWPQLVNSAIKSPLR